MKPVIRRSAALILCVLAAACGQTGELYRPDQIPSSQMSPSQRDAAKKAQAPTPAPESTAPAPASESPTPSALS